MGPTRLKRLMALACWSDDSADKDSGQRCVMLGFSLMMSFGGLLWGSLCLLNGLVVPSLIPFAYAAIALPLVVLTVLFPRLFSIFTNIQLFISLALPFMFQWSMGGFAASGSVSLWSMSALIGSLLIVGPKRSISWLGLYLWLVIFSGFVDSSLPQTYAPKALSSGAMAAINVFCVTLMVFLVSRVFLRKIDSHQENLESSLKKLKAELEEAHQQALHADKLATIGKLAAGVGHEINNPLAISSGYLDRVIELVKKSGIDSKELSEALRKQKAANKRIRSVVDGMRIFARNDSEVVEDVDLHSMVFQSIDLVKEIYDNEGVKISYKVPVEHPLVKGSAGKLQQVLFNLIQNAKDATEGLDSRRIEVAVGSVRNSAYFKVTDNGSGMCEEVKSKIFSPFYTTKGSGKGTGMGLGIVMEIVEQLGGDIQVDSVVGEGSSFLVHFPLAGFSLSSREDLAQESEVPETVELASSGPKKSDEGEVLNRRKLKVLVVDDEPELREILSDLISSFGCEVSTCASGEEALNAILATGYDYVFSDVNMPDLSGVDLVRRLSEINFLKPPQVYLVTGDSFLDPNEEPTLQSSTVFKGIILKPFRRTEIKSVLLGADQLKSVAA